MLKSINTFIYPENISFYLTGKDTIISETIYERDSLTPVDKYIEDGIIDSIPMVSKIEIHDTIISDSVISKPEQKVQVEIKKPVRPETVKIYDTPGEYFSEGLTWNTSENILIRHDNYDTVSCPDTLSVSALQDNATLSIEPVRRDVISNDWILGLFMFISLLFLWVKTFYKKYFSLLLGSLLSYQVSLKLMRERNIITRRVSFILNFIYAIVLAAFILKTFEFYEIKIFNFSKFETLLILINFIIILSVMRLFILNLVGLIFNSTQIFNEYIHNNFIINKNLGLFLFPLLIMQVYIAEEIKIIFIITGISLIIISYIIRFYRGFQIIIKKDIFLFYLILYLCTLEILPVLLGYKLFFLLV